MSDTGETNEIEYVGQSKYKLTIPHNKLILENRDLAEVTRAIERGVNGLPLGTQAEPPFHPGRFSNSARGWWDFSQSVWGHGETIDDVSNLITMDEDEALTGVNVTYDVNAIGARFDGGARLDFNAVSSWFSNSNATTFFVAESGSQASNQVLIEDRNTSWTDFGFYLSPGSGGIADRLRFVARQPNNTTSDSGQIISATGSRRIYWYIVDNSDTGITFGDDQDVRFNDSWGVYFGSAGSSRKGIGGSRGQGFIGIIHEVINYSSVLSDTERNNILAALAAKWSITPPPPVAESIGGVTEGELQAVDDDLQTHKNLTTTAHGGLVPSTRTVTAGTGLTGGGDLSANRSLAPDFGDGPGKVVQGNNPRVLPTPVGVPDGKIPVTLTGAFVLADPTGAVETVAGVSPTTGDIPRADLLTALGDPDETANAILSDGTVAETIALTQAAYDALTPPDPKVQYIITDGEPVYDRILLASPDTTVWAVTVDDLGALSVDPT